MKVPIKWLADFITTDLPPNELADKLTMAGLEAEKITRIGEMWADKVFVGHVETVARHPDADRLVLATVDVGQHRLTVVTGAPNIAQGQQVALAIAGARLYDGHSDELVVKTLKPGSIRGVKSEGMVCSEKELGLSEEHEGILILPDDAPTGQPLIDYLGDTVIEFEITPNLSHAFSIHGIAREVHALTGAPISLPPALALSTLPAATEPLVSNTVPDRCPRFIAAVIEGIAVAPSPAWMVRRLEAAGLRAINNVVDVTNYVMHELGQPMHAFDRDRVVGGRIIVRAATEGEQLLTLDHVHRSLDPSVTVIADDERVVGLAGVIGGLNAEVSDATTNVLLECASWDMFVTRRTARKLRVRTDAAARYERGLDTELPAAAIARAAHLLLELCPDAHVVGIQDDYPRPDQPVKITLPVEHVASLVGVVYDNSEIAGILSRLEFKPSIDGGDLTVSVPPYRRDVRRRQDVIEEIARIAGYERLPATIPSGELPPVHRDPVYRLRRAIRSNLVAAGYSEAITYITVDEGDLTPFVVASSASWLASDRAAGWRRLVNPMNPDRPALRPTLIPSLVEAAAANLKHTDSIRLFELAHVYLPSESDAEWREVEMCCLVAVGQRDHVGLTTDRAEMDVLDLKGAVETVLRRRGATDLSFEQVALAGFHPGRAADVRFGSERIGRIGELHPDTAAHLGIDGSRVSVGEIDLDLLLSLLPRDNRDTPVWRTLPVEQDFAIVVAEETPVGDVQSALTRAAGPLATTVRLFDVYRGPSIGDGRKSLAFRITFTAPDRSLTDHDIAKFRPKIEKVLKQQVGGVLRV